jgi:hypothetical protein
VISGQWAVVREVEERARLLPTRLLIIAGIFFFGALSTYACQESCRIIAANPVWVQLRDADGKELRNANVLIRHADVDEQGPKTFCNARKGRIAKRLRTNRQGKFDLRGLASGTYWITYLDKKNGESFLVTRVESLPARDLKLSIRSLAGLCYLVDIERNETIPPGWKKPVLESTP